MSLSTAPCVKNSNIEARIYFIFVENNLKNMKSVIISNLDLIKKTSEKRSERQLPRKVNFSTFLHLYCPNFRLKL